MEVLDTFVTQLERDARWWSDAQLPLQIATTEIIVERVEHSECNAKTVRRLLSWLVNAVAPDKPSESRASLMVSVKISWIA
jgi:hypothetical protein